MNDASNDMKPQGAVYLQLAILTLVLTDLLLSQAGSDY